MPADRLYDPDDGRWTEYHRLPAFDPLAVPPTGPRPPDLDTAADFQAVAVADLFSRYAPPPPPTPPPLDRDTEWDDDSDSPGWADQQRRADALHALDALRRHQGLTPVRFDDPDQSGPSAEQDAALRYLLANQERLARIVLEQMFDWDRRIGEQPLPGMRASPPLGSPDELIGRVRVASVRVSHQQHNGSAYLVFVIDDWDMEHGAAVVVHQDKPPVWTTFDEIDDLTASDDEPEYVPTDHDWLLDAVLAGDTARANELRAAGADLNQLTESALCAAVMQYDAELVDRLLAAGADPNRPDTYDGRTPLRKVLREQADLGFRRAGRTPWWVCPVWLLMRVAARREMTRVRAALARMEKALTAAGGRA